MIKTLKISLAVSVCLGVSSLSVLAQDKASNSSEIVMSKAELDSFLEKIAALKRAQMQKRANEIKVNKGFETITAETKVNASTSNDGNLNNAMLLREFDRINNRIDLLMLSSGAGNRTVASYPQVLPFNNVPATQPTITAVPVNPQVVSGGTGVVSAVVDEETERRIMAELELEKLNASNAQLVEELRVVNALSDNGRDAKYQEEIANLNARIEQMNDAIAAVGNSSRTTVYKVNEFDPIKKGLEQYSKAIYFANNSYTVSTQDQAALNEVVDIVKKHSPNVTVVLRGYASAKGNAMYNNTLSFNRAEAIKKVLLQKGLSAKDIMTMHHGVDHSGNETTSRRVEVNLLVQ